MLTQAETQFALLAFSSLFSVINPISAARVPDRRRRHFRDPVRPHVPERREGAPGEDAETPDPSIVPLGIPVIAGPGTITTVMVLVGQAQDGARRLALGGAIAVNVLLTLLILLAAPAIVAWIGATGQRIVSKIMGLITAVVGIQFVIDA